jgi:predicted DNA binding protein
MRRLIVEISVQDFNQLDPERSDLLRNIKSMEVLHFLRSDYQEVAVIARVEFNKPNVSIEDLFRNDLVEVEVQLLEREKEKEQEEENEIYTYFIKAKPTQTTPNRLDPTAIRGYISPPLEVRDGCVKITFLGSAKQMRTILALLEDAGLRHRVVSHSDAQFLPHSPLSRLTEKQRKVFVTAYALGYYDLPRRVNLAQLAEKLDLAHSTLDAHLRKAERRLLNYLMNES